MVEPKGCKNEYFKWRCIDFLYSGNFKLLSQTDDYFFKIIIFVRHGHGDDSCWAPGNLSVPLPVMLFMLSDFSCTILKLNMKTATCANMLEHIQHG